MVRSTPPAGFGSLGRKNLCTAPGRRDLIRRSSSDSWGGCRNQTGRSGTPGATSPSHTAISCSPGWRCGWTWSRQSLFIPVSLWSDEWSAERIAQESEFHRQFHLSTVACMTEADETYDPTRHPDLLAWLAEREGAHAAWAAQTSFADVLDFSPASLAILDDPIRETANSMEEITDRRMTPFVQGAIWYVGEVFCRHKGMVWKYIPDLVSGQLEPFFNAGAETSALDHPCVGAPGDPDSYVYPVNAIRRILLTEDEVGNKVDDSLPSIFADPFGEDDEEMDPSAGWG